MIFTIIDITLGITIWSLKKMYGAIFGNKTETMLLLENQTKTIELLRIDLATITKKLNKIES